MPKKLTNDEFKVKIWNLVGNEYTFLEDYVNSNTEILVRHNKCGQEYKVKPHRFISSGNRCPICNRENKSRRLTLSNDEFRDKIHDLVSDDYTFLNKYIDSNTKIKCRHNKCGYIWLVSPNSFISGGIRCPRCSKLKMHYRNNLKTSKQFKQEVYELVGDEYSVIGDYFNRRTKIKIQHNSCGLIYETLPNTFLTGSRCPKCRYKTISHKLKMTNKDFTQEVYNLVGNEYTFLDNYKDSYTPIRVRHNKCGRVYKVRPNYFISGNRCPSCSLEIRVAKNTKTNEDFVKEVYNLVGNEYTFLDDYLNNKTELWVRHNRCGYKYQVTPHNFLEGYRCPRCFTKNSSHGEYYISQILDNLGINYDLHKHFDWLNYKGHQHLDFYLPDYKLAIEYDGKQHYDKNDNRYSEIGVLRDRNKDKLLKIHHIKLLRIPYTISTKKEIEKVIRDELNYYAN